MNKFPLLALPLFLALLTPTLAAADSHAITKATVEDYEARTFTSPKGDKIQYRLFIPRNYDPKTKYPLVVFHHGGGGTGDDNLGNLEGPLPFEWASPERQAHNPSFIVAPQIPRGGRQETDTPRQEIMRNQIRTIHQLLDALEKEFSIDTNREYITGLSMGGTCTWLSLTERPDRFAAAAPVCSGYKFIGLESHALGKQFPKLPLWIFHGDADEVVSVDYSREIVQALKDAGGKPNYTEYPGVNHDSWTLAYRDEKFINWLFAQSIKSK